MDFLRNENVVGFLFLIAVGAGYFWYWYGKRHRALHALPEGWRVIAASDGERVAPEHHETAEKIMAALDAGDGKHVVLIHDRETDPSGVVRAFAEKVAARHGKHVVEVSFAEPAEARTALARLGELRGRAVLMLASLYDLFRAPKAGRRDIIRPVLLRVLEQTPVTVTGTLTLQDYLRLLHNDDFSSLFRPVFYGDAERFGREVVYALRAKFERTYDVVYTDDAVQAAWAVIERERVQTTERMVAMASQILDAAGQAIIADMRGLDKQRRAMEKEMARARLLMQRATGPEERRAEQTFREVRVMHHELVEEMQRRMLGGRPCITGRIIQITIQDTLR